MKFVNYLWLAVLILNSIQKLKVVASSIQSSSLGTLESPGGVEPSCWIMSTHTKEKSLFAFFRPDCKLTKNFMDH